MRLVNPTVDRAERRRLVAAVVVLALGTLLAYARTFDVPWYFDDVPNLVENPVIRDLANFFEASALEGSGASPAQLYGLRSRWVAFLTFAFDFRRAGYSLAAFHATNLAVHVLAAILLLFLLRRLFVGRPRLALFGALVFALHPLQTGAVTYVVQRMASLAGLLCLAAVLLFLRARDELAARGQMRWIRFAVPYLGTLACGAAACFAKQNAIVLPALVGLVEVLHPVREVQWSWGRRILRVLPLAVVPLWISLPVAQEIVSSPNSSVAAPAADVEVVSEATSPLANLATQSEVIWRYLRRIVLPYGQVFDFGLTVDPNPWRPSAIAAGLGLIALAGAALAVRRRAPVVTLGTLWFFAALAVESSVYVLDPYFEHRLYLPMAGVAMVAAAGVGSLPQAGTRSRTVVAVLVVTSLALLTWRRNEQWRDPVKLWRADLEAGAVGYRSLLGLGDALFRRGDGEAAREVYETFLDRAERRCRNSPCSARYRLNMGIAAERTGDVDRARSLYRAAAVESPSYALAHYNLGVLQYRAGELVAALASFRRAATYAPGDPDPLFNWAVTALELGDPAPALRAEPMLRSVAPQLADELAERLREHEASTLRGGDAGDRP